MLGVTYEHNFPNIQSDGIIGVAPKVPYGEYAESFVTQLFNAGVIAKNAFGVDYRASDSTSKVILGGYDTTIIEDDSSFNFINLTDSYYWSVNYNKTTYGDQDIIFKQRTYAILDTGTSLAYWPEYIYTQLYEKISANRTCGITNRGYKAWVCETVDDFQNITLQFDDRIYYFPPSTYAELNQIANGSICEFNIESMDLFGRQDTALIGDSFIMNYYLYHDVENMRVGFYGDSTKVNLETPDDITTETFGTSFASWTNANQAILFIVLFAAVSSTL